MRKESSSASFSDFFDLSAAFAFEFYGRPSSLFSSSFIFSPSGCFAVNHSFRPCAAPLFGDLAIRLFQVALRLRG